MGFGTEAFNSWLPYPAAAIRGITSTTGLGEKQQKQQDTGDQFKDAMNNLWDNAMRGIFEPETINPTSIHIQEHPEIFGKTNHATAAVWGTLAEFTATMSLNPLALIPEGFQALSKEAQNTLLFNKLTQSSQWGDNINAIAGKMGVSWQKILPQAQRELWDAITKGNYFQVVLKNLELYQPFKLVGLTTEDVGEALPLPEKFQLKPTVIVKGKEPSFGVDHEEALNKLGMSKESAIEGKDFRAGFTTPTGQFLTREEADKQYGVGQSEDIPLEARQKAVQSETVAPYEVQEPVAPKNLIAMRQNYLEDQSSQIDAQMKLLELQKKQREDMGLSTYSIDAKLDKLGKRWLSNESVIAENIIGKVKVNEIQNEIGQVKINKVGGL